MRSLTAVVQLLLTAGASASYMRNNGGMHVGPIDEVNALVSGNGTAGWGTFEQLIDHSRPELGTFDQRYWYATQYWKGPGSPIILVNPGEQAADGFNISYPTSQRLTGLMAEKVGGAVVILEHRYWGESSPFENLTVENLQYLTLENSIKDNTYFARNFKAPFDRAGKSSAKDAPWVFTGGSYPGALAGWIAAKDPGTFWAYYGTSGVVEAIGDFWQYFVPVQEATPQNCSSDLSAAIEYIDTILLHGAPNEKAELKNKFKLGDLEDADFAAALENGPWTWQSGQFYSATSEGYTPYYQFCDYIENVFPNTTSAVPGAEGVGLVRAIEGYAKWFKEVSLPGYCEGYGYFSGKYNTECYQALNASNPIYHDLSVGNPGNRQWNWMLCNEPFEYWQDGAPIDRPTIVSRLSNVEYWRSQCPLWFPGTEYGIAKGKSAEDVNKYTGGWSDVNVTRLMMTNGQWDPWRDSTLSSIFRPGGPKESTPEFPIRVVKEGTHCSDLYGQNWAVNPGVKALADEEVANMATWVQEFYDQKK
ncbi:peptidase S28 [Whalleya microplaca]|nr:peptidase S28 [Whalleya microplaca]